MREHVVNAGLGRPSLWDLFKERLHAGRAAGREPVSSVVKPWAPDPADAAIRQALLGRMAGQNWWHPLVSNVVVIHGAVIYQGLYYGNDEKRAGRNAVRGIPGVRELRDARVRAST